MVKVVTTHLDDDDKPVVTDLEIDTTGNNITCVLHQQGLKVDVPEFVEINPQDTIACMVVMTQGEWEWISTGEIFCHLWNLAFDPSDRRDPPKSIETMNMLDMGLRHMAGIIVLSVETMLAGKSIFLRNPETYLHPKTERHIMTMLNEMLKLCGGSGTVEATEEEPEKLEKHKKISNEVKEEAMEAAKEELKGETKEPDPEENKKQTLLWLKCMGPDKEIVEFEGQRLTAQLIASEVEDNTEIGREFIAKYVELRDKSLGDKE